MSPKPVYYGFFLWHLFVKALTALKNSDRVNKQLKNIKGKEIW